MNELDAEIEELKTNLAALRTQKKREHMREYMRKRRVRPDVREKRREYQREYMREYWKRPEVKLRRRLRKAGLSKEVIAAEVARFLAARAAE